MRAYRHQGGGAKIILKKVPDPQRFGVPELDGQRVVRIEEKPRSPKSEYAVIGIYMYDCEMFTTSFALSSLRVAANWRLRMSTMLTSSATR